MWCAVKNACKIIGSWYKEWLEKFEEVGDANPQLWSRRRIGLSPFSLNGTSHTIRFLVLLHTLCVLFQILSLLTGADIFNAPVFVFYICAFFHVIGRLFLTPYHFSIAHLQMWQDRRGEEQSLKRQFCFKTWTKFLAVEFADPLRLPTCEATKVNPNSWARLRKWRRKSLESILSLRTKSINI